MFIFLCLTLEFISSWGKLNALWHRSLWHTCHFCALHSVAKVFVEHWIFLYLWMISVLSLLLQIKLLKLSEEKKYQKKVVVRIIKYLSAKNNNFSNWLDQFIRIRWKIWLFETVQIVLCTSSLSWSKFHKELSHNFLRVSTQSRMHLGVSNICKGCWEILGVIYST